MSARPFFAVRYTGRKPPFNLVWFPGEPDGFGNGDNPTYAVDQGPEGATTFHSKFKAGLAVKCLARRRPLQFKGRLEVIEFPETEGERKKRESTGKLDALMMGSAPDNT